MILSRQVTRLQALSLRFDLAVLGGGVIGAGIARDAALRGLSVALVDKQDFGGGTTAGSTRLIHGGLRYLEMLDFRLVRMDLREREALLRTAAHLVRPLEFLLPFYGRSLFYRARMRAGMLLYAALSFDKNLPNYRFLNARETLSEEPGLLANGLQGSAAYFDAQIDSPERLALENILEAREHGAVALNYVEATGALEAGGALNGVRVRDTLTGEQADLRARVVVNASGPWFDALAARLGPCPKRRIRTTLGIHLACQPVNRRATVLFSWRDSRLFFVIPWLGFSWVGTTDTDFAGDPGQARATREDIDYLRSSAAQFFPALAGSQVYWTCAGVRALVRKPGSESSVSRMHRIQSERPGLISVLGGKITGYRAIAEEATDRACRELRVSRRSETAERPLPGCRRKPDPDASHLSRIYGCRAQEVRELAAADPALAQRLAPEYPDLAAQVVHAARHEQCLRVPDFVFRRSLLGFTPDQGRGAVAAVARLMAGELGWTEAQTHAEIQHYEAMCT
jgi:glycerol-3-phosphate dehydrogenase